MSRWNHCFIYIGDGNIVEANPTGVAISPVTKYPKIAWNQHEEIADSQRTVISDFAKSRVGDPYSFGTIAGLVLRILGFKLFSQVLLKKLSTGRDYICSELVAECYEKSGYQLLDCPSYLVTPGDLAERLVYQ